MAAVINTNITSLNAQRNLATAQSAMNQSIQRLSSGLRVNSSKDDAAGMAIASRMDAQIRGQDVAVRNANDAISFAQTAEGAVSKVSDSLQRMRELAVQAANGTYSSGDLSNLDAEYQQLSAEITRVTGNTKFNGTSVFGASTTFQIGSGTADTITMSAISSSNITQGGSISTAALATAAMSSIDTALDNANTTRATLGAYQNRFDSVIANLQVSTENMSSAKSRIMDADFAAETAKMTRAQILQQAGTAMLAQANQLPNSVMTLLR